MCQALVFGFYATKSPACHNRYNTVSVLKLYFFLLSWRATDLIKNKQCIKWLKYKDKIYPLRAITKRAVSSMTNVSDTRFNLSLSRQ